MLANAPRPLPRKLERRRHQRVPIALLGRYMLADRQEYPCQTIDMSPGGAHVAGPVKGEIGERVIAYLEHIGRLEGEITRHTEQGFAFSIAAAMRKRDKIASQLTWLANRQDLGLPEDRRHERVAPRLTSTVVRLESGRELGARIIDVSLSGAGLALEQKLPLGTPVTVGNTPAIVVRHFKGGIAVEFRLMLSPDRLDEGVVL
ncbi:PilZ domain-containing protein [Enterovirga rhinocerotis]|uniref:PilZ domain-containing protein n=1 Tax=Enterovirga rhinocerotis TaxID=1339210 RepID=A0A4R7CAA1_9HYPH|nr:PilZ domain-containing protein [Enterovirga rhinocerotis]TDR93727.1 PilZ domain-containing protein [Enterovirga rhinocerotis]